MTEPTPNRSTFYGTYFDRDSVLRLEKWSRILAWAILAMYLLQAAYDGGNSIYNAIASNSWLDMYFVFNTFSRPLQGALLFVVLQMVGKGLLILMDIEENTRRAIRK